MTLSERGNTVNVADETIEDLVNTEDTEGGVEGLRVWAESIDPDNRATQAVDTQNSIGEDVGDGSKGQRSDEDEDEGQKHHGSEVAPHTRARRGNKRTRKRKAPSCNGCTSQNGSTLEADSAYRLFPQSPVSRVFRIEFRGDYNSYSNWGVNKNNPNDYIQ